MSWFRKIFVSMYLLFNILNIASAMESKFDEELGKNNEKMRELYKSEGKVNEEIEFLENQLVSIADEISSKQKTIEKYNASIDGYENSVHILNKNVDELNKEIYDVENNISKNIESMNQLQNEIDKFKDVISKRIRNLYMHMDVYKPILRILYTSENVIDLSERIDNMIKFIDIDRSMMEKFLKNIYDLELVNSNTEILKQSLESKMALINERIKENDENLIQLKEQKELKQKELDEISELNNEIKNRYAGLSDERKLIQQELIKIHQDNYKIQEELKKYLDSLNQDNRNTNSKVNYGKYLKPAQGIITSKYGERVHPIAVQRSFHTGIDIAGNKGDLIMASLSGKVVSAGWYNSVYGNVVIINHGNNIQTFYAHLDQVNVEVGQDVMGGGIIGKMGNTGLSTGTHLHFEIRVNGEHVDPLKRIKN